MFAGVLAFLVSIVAAFLVYYSWKAGRLAWVAGMGWLLAFASIAGWARVLGQEFGLAYAIAIFVCLAWAAVAFNMEGRSQGDQAALRPFQRLRWPGRQDGIRHATLFLLAVPATGVTAMMLSVALVLYLPWALPLKLAVAVFLYPVLWGALGSWICAQDTCLKPLLANAGLLVVSGLILFV